MKRGDVRNLVLEVLERNTRYAGVDERLHLVSDLSISYGGFQDLAVALENRFDTFFSGMFLENLALSDYVETPFESSIGENSHGIITARKFEQLRKDYRGDYFSGLPKEPRVSDVLEKITVGAIVDYIGGKLNGTE